jgi:hypothetical protein
MVTGLIETPPDAPMGRGVDGRAPAAGVAGVPDRALDAAAPGPWGLAQGVEPPPDESTSMPEAPDDGVRAGALTAHAVEVLPEPRAASPIAPMPAPVADARRRSGGFAEGTPRLPTPGSAGRQRPGPQVHIAPAPEAVQRPGRRRGAPVNRTLGIWALGAVAVLISERGPRPRSGG